MSKCILNTMTMSSTEDSSEPLSSSTLAICDTAVSDRHHSPTIMRRSLLIRMVFILYIYLSVCVFCTSGATATRSPPVGTKLSNYSQTTPSHPLFLACMPFVLTLFVAFRQRTPFGVRAYRNWSTPVSQVPYARTAFAVRPPDATPGTARSTPWHGLAALTASVRVTLCQPLLLVPHLWHTFC